MSSYADRLKKTIELRKGKHRQIEGDATATDATLQVSQDNITPVEKAIFDLFGPCDVTVEEQAAEILTEREVLILVTVFNRWREKLNRADAFMSSPRVPTATKDKHAAEYEKLIKDVSWLRRTLDDIYFEVYSVYGITLMEGNAGFIKPQRERRRAA